MISDTNGNTIIAGATSHLHSELKYAREEMTNDQPTGTRVCVCVCVCMYVCVCNALVDLL
jgi:hypothetical protein